MTAITGIYQWEDDLSLPAQGSALMQALTKYAADRTCTWQNAHVFLGCHAQWITPESVEERLPNFDAVRQLAITADAIIDNRDQLMDRLHIEPSCRATMTDSQLILLAYVKWGEEVPNYLIGDFAFLIWDERRRRFFGARDFCGSRTLYYYQDAKRFACCTVMEPLLRLAYVRPDLNDAWLAQFLASMATVDAVDPSSTVYGAIKLLPPAHRITVTASGARLTRYCTIEPGEKLRLKGHDQYVEAFRDVFGDAVRARLRTHHEVGAQLSGGLDSGAVASFAAKQLSAQHKQLHTFSYIPVDGFVDWTPRSRFANESSYIQSTIDYVGNMTRCDVVVPDRNPYTEVDDWLDMMEMPYKFFENAYWLKGIYEQAQQQGVGVLLNGQRGNWTVSWGPPLDYMASLLRRVKLYRYYRELHAYSQHKGVPIARLLSSSRKKAFPQLTRLFSNNAPYEVPALIHPDFAQETNVFKLMAQAGQAHTDYALQCAYRIRENHFKQLNMWGLNGTIGTKISLRYRLRDRDPTNDLRVIRFCLSVPEEQCVQNGIDRLLIRRATEGYLPDQVRLNIKTRGVQGADGVYRMERSWPIFLGEAEQLLTDSTVSSYLNVEQLRASLAKIKQTPKPEYIYDFDFKLVMRALIFARFMKKMKVT